MPTETFIPSNDEWQAAEKTLTDSAQQCGLDVSEPKVRAFIDAQTDVKAAHLAAIRFYSNCLHPR